MTKRYELSTDYLILANELIAGKKVACIIDCILRNSDIADRDVAASLYYNVDECYYIAVRGFVYVQENTVEGFIESCKRFNVEFFKECDL